VESFEAFEAQARDLFQELHKDADASTTRVVGEVGQLLEEFLRDLGAMERETSRTGAEFIRGNLIQAMEKADQTRIQIEGALMRLGRIRGEFNP